MRKLSSKHILMRGMTALLSFFLSIGFVNGQDLPEVTDYSPKSLCTNNQLRIQGKNLDMIKGIQVGDNVVPTELFEANLTATMVTVNNLQLPNLTTGNYDLIISGDGFRDTVGNLNVKALEVEIEIADRRNTVCEGATVILSSSVGQVSYQWNTGAETSSIEVIVTEETDFSLTITDNQGCEAVAEQTIFTLPNPTASIAVSPNTEICAGQEVTLTSSPADRYFWSTGAETRSITETPAETTTYELTVEGVNGCRTTTEVDIKTRPGPDVTISGPTEVCAGVPFTLTAGGADNYSWHDGEMTPSINVSLEQDMTYSVKGTNAEGCEAEASIDITVNPSPEVNITGPDEICKEQVVQLKATRNQNWNYQWSQTAMGSILSTVNIAPSQNTTYSVTVTDKNNNCKSEASKEVKVTDNLAFTIMGPDSVCRGEEAVLSIIQNENFQYKWSTGGTSFEEKVVPNSNTTYSATVTDPTRGCTGVATKRVKARVVIPKIHGPSVVCEGTTVELRAGGGTQYVWKDGSTEDTIRVTLMQTTDFFLTVTDEINCTADVQKRIEVNEVPSLTVDGPRTICSEERTDLFLDTDVEDAVISWTSDGNMGSGSGSGPNGSMITDLLVNDSSEHQTTVYTITAESPAGCGSEIKRVTVTVNAFTENTILPYDNLKILTGQEIDIDFQAVGGASNVEWTPIETVGRVEGATPGAGDTFSQTLKLSDSKSWGLVRFQLEASSGNNGGRTCAELRQYLDVKVLPRSLINNIFIPNLFTPNGDGVNDRWGIEYVSEIDPTEYHITVFSRNGTVVLPERNIFEAANWEAQGVPAGAYVYILKGPEMTYKGAITIQK